MRYHFEIGISFLRIIFSFQVIEIFFVTYVLCLALIIMYCIVDFIDDILCLALIIMYCIVDFIDDVLCLALIIMYCIVDFIDDVLCLALIIMYCIVDFIDEKSMFTRSCGQKNSMKVLPET